MHGPFYSPEGIGRVSHMEKHTILPHNASGNLTLPCAGATLYPLQLRPFSVSYIVTNAHLKGSH